MRSIPSAFLAVRRVSTPPWKSHWPRKGSTHPELTAYQLTETPPASRCEQVCRRHQSRRGRKLPGSSARTRRCGWNRQGVVHAQTCWPELRRARTFEEGRVPGSFAERRIATQPKLDLGAVGARFFPRPVSGGSHLAAHPRCAV